MQLQWYRAAQLAVLVVVIGVAVAPLGVGAAETGTNALIDPLGGATFRGLLDNVFQFLVDIAIPLGVIFIVYAGIKYLTAHGDETKAQEAKKALTYAVIGVAIIIVGRGLIDVVLDIIGASNGG